MKTIRCTKRAFDQIMRSLLEVGFTGLSRDEQDVCNASDAGTLTIIEPVYREYNEMCGVGRDKSPTAA